MEMSQRYQRTKYVSKRQNNCLRWLETGKKLVVCFNWKYRSCAIETFACAIPGENFLTNKSAATNTEQPAIKVNYMDVHMQSGGYD